MAGLPYTFGSCAVDLEADACFWAVCLVCAALSPLAPVPAVPGRAAGPAALDAGCVLIVGRSCRAVAGAEPLVEPPERGAFLLCRD